MTFSKSRSQLGFTLIEVMVALAVLALSIGVIIDANVATLMSVQRIDGITTATLLARSKMNDIERQLIKEGFKLDGEKRQGNFEEEGYPSFMWSAQIEEIKLQVDKLMDFASSMSGASGASDQPAAQGSPMGGVMGMVKPLLEPITKSITANARHVTLEISWPEGKKKRGSFKVSTIVTSRQMQQATPSLPPGGVPGAVAPAAPMPIAPAAAR